MAEIPAVKSWLATVTNRMRTVFLRSNLYKTLPMIYGDLGVFGTAAMVMEEDFDQVIRTIPLPIGSYFLGNDEKLRIRLFFREFRMTVRQLIDKFGRRGPDPNDIDWKIFTERVRAMWENGQPEIWIDVCHVIEPNQDFDPSRPEGKFKKFRSTYFESATDSNTGTREVTGLLQDRFLSDSGFDFFPVLAPRWEVTGEDVYGTDCPGMTSLGDIKQLQQGERRGLQAIDKMVNPPMTGPSHLKTTKASILPGDITYIDVRDGQQGFRPSHEVTFRLQEHEQKQAGVRFRIRRSFFEDLFLMLANSDRREITAREIDERHEEKLLAIGPVLEQLNQDLLDPLVDNTFDIMNRQGLIPDPPPELQGLTLKVEYISIMAQAQKLAGLAGIERFLTDVSQIATVQPQVLDKVDLDQSVDEIAETLGVPPGMVVDDQRVAAIRQQRAQAEARQRESEQMRETAKSVKDLSDAKLTEDSTLKRLVNAAEAGQAAPGP
jgi:hypothetical protein